MLGRIKGFSVRSGVDDILAGAVALAVYVLTLAPSVTTGDSGELITAAAKLELAHPTGYPLYILLGKAFVTAFFFLSPDVAMNLFSAVGAALAVVLARRLAESVTGDRWVASATALVFAFSASMWSQATTARVYTLNAVLVLIVLVELVRLHREGGGSTARAWAFAGLAMANHTVSIVLVPLLVAATWRYGRGVLTRVRAVAWCVPGLSLYLYIPLTASLGPYQNWGDPSTLTNLVDYLARTGYWDRSYVKGAGDALAVAWHYVTLLPGELTWPGAVLVALGLVVGARRAPVVTSAGVFLFAANAALMILHGSRADIFHWPRYMITGWIGLLPVFSLGLAHLLRWTKKKWASASIAALLAATAIATGFDSGDRSGPGLARAFNAKILEMVEEGATVFGEGDNVLFPLIYLHHVEGMRPDVTLVLQGVNELKSMVIDPDNRPIYFTHHHDLGAPEIELVPDGLLYRLVRRGSGFEGRSWQRWAVDEFERIEGPGRLRYLDRNLVGDYLFMKAVNHVGNRDLVRRILHRAMSVDHDNAKTFLNAGLMFERSLAFDEALEAFGRAREIDPRDELAAGRVDLWKGVLSKVAGAKRPEDRASRLAAALYERGRAAQAVAVLREASSALKRSFKLRYNLAALLIASGDMEAAEKALVAALDLQPEDALAKRDLEQVRKILAAKPRKPKGPVWTKQEREIYDGIPSSIEFALPSASGRLPEEAAAAAWAEFERIGRVVDSFDPLSEVGRLNADTAKVEAVVSADVARLLRVSREIWEATGGAFDPTVWPLKVLWDEARDRQAVPDPSSVKDAAARVGMGLVGPASDGGAIRFRRPSVALDFGGVAKGYAVDRVLAGLQGMGAVSALVRCGGEIGTLGNAPDGGPWKVGVRDPLGTGARGVLSGPARMAVSTSGNYEQPYDVGGRRYYHIFDPRKGEPIPTDVLSVTVAITGDHPLAAMADGLATALAVLGPEKGLEALKSFDGAGAIFVVRDGKSVREAVSPGLGSIYRPSAAGAVLK